MKDSCCLLFDHLMSRESYLRDVLYQKENTLDERYLQITWSNNASYGK